MLMAQTPSHLLGTLHKVAGPAHSCMPSGGTVSTRRCIALHAKTPTGNTKLAGAIELRISVFWSVSSFRLPSFCIHMQFSLVASDSV